MNARTHPGLVSFKNLNVQSLRWKGSTHIDMCHLCRAAMFCVLQLVISLLFLLQKIQAFQNQIYLFGIILNFMWGNVRGNINYINKAGKFWLLSKMRNRKHSLVAKLKLTNPTWHEFNAVWGQAHAEIMLQDSAAQWGWLHVAEKEGYEELWDRQFIDIMETETLQSDLLSNVSIFFLPY